MLHNEKHTDAAARSRNKDENLEPLKLTQGVIYFLIRASVSCASFADELHKAEAAFAMDVVAKSVPYLFVDTTNILFPLVFADSQLAKKIIC